MGLFVPIDGIPRHVARGGNNGKPSGNDGKQRSATVLARAKGERVPRRAIARPLAHAARDGDLKGSGRGASLCFDRRRLPAASTTGHGAHDPLS